MANDPSLKEFEIDGGDPLNVAYGKLNAFIQGLDGTLAQNLEAMKAVQAEMKKSEDERAMVQSMGGML